MLNAYLSFGVAASACAALYNCEYLLSVISAFAAKPVNLQGHPTDGRFRPTWEAEGLHPFEFFGLSESGISSTQSMEATNDQTIRHLDLLVLDEMTVGYRIKSVRLIAHHICFRNRACLFAKDWSDYNGRSV